MRILSFHSQKKHVTPVNESINNKYAIDTLSLTTIELLSYQQLSKTEKHNLLINNTIAITSKNAALWLVNNLKNWKGMIYTNSEKSNAILQKMPDVNIKVSESGYAKDLGHLIYQSGVTSYLHLTGNLGLDDLNISAREHSIEYKRLEVYKTTLTPQTCNLNEVDVCIFTSPSQVESFFKVNTWKKSIFALCIGKTTAKNLINHGVQTHQVIYPQKANYNAMLELLPDIEKKIEQQKIR